MTATEVLINIGFDRPNRTQVRDTGKILRKVLGDEPRKSNGKMVFSMPRKITVSEANYDEPAF